MTAKKEDPLSRAKAKAKSAEKRARSALERIVDEDGELDTLVDRITAIENIPKSASTKPGLEFHGPGGVQLRIFGLGGWHLVAAIAAVAAVIATVWASMR